MCTNLVVVANAKLNTRTCRGHRQRSRLLPSSSSAHHYQYHVRPTASGAGGLTRLPVIVHSRPQPPPLVALVPLADETASSGTTTTTPVATVCRWSPRDNIV
ncbi:unnamed protein product [Mesocestoides corti]|uniref:Uncharacterized protein n=1 Tax=Mesocestoides corti TaxID=53468 RepID=A0A0R3U9S7_MESCO|nr:unnamed protein product [Mesocestoides corti]